MTVEAVLVPAPFGWVQLQLHYDGRHPPVHLLEDLAALGWSVPPPPSRPASAIVWTPDPSTGERFTVRPWRAVHDLDPPGRFVAQATWEPESRQQALQDLAGVFGAHGVEVRSPAPELVELVRPAASMHSDHADYTRSNPAPTVVVFTAPIDRIERIESFLQATGLAYQASTEARTRRQLFRGAITEQEVMVVVGEVLIGEDQADDLRARLRDEQAFVEERAATSDDVVRLEAQRVRSPRGDESGGPWADRPAPVVLSLELVAAATGVVDRIVAHPALTGLPVTVSPTTRPVPTSFRGSSGEAARPTLHIEVSCPPGRAMVVRSVLAREGGVAPADVALGRPPDR